MNLDLESLYGDGWYDGFLAARKLIEDGHQIDEYKDYDILSLSEHAETELPSQLRTRWNKEPPSAQGLYWHWSGDVDDSPIVLSILYSGTKKECFVSVGQYGINNAVFCGKYGGYWSACVEPALPEL